MEHKHAPGELDSLVARARRGERGAWDQLVARFDPLIRAQARSYGWVGADVDDVSQETWTIVFRNLCTVRDPSRLAGWIKVVAANAARRRHRGTWVVAASEPDEAPGGSTATDQEVILLLTHDVVRAAVDALSDRDRALVELLSDERPYVEISRALDMPVGSIGPTRQRILARLRRQPELRAWALAV